MPDELTPHDYDARNDGRVQQLLSANAVLKDDFLAGMRRFNQLHLRRILYTQLLIYSFLIQSIIGAQNRLGHVPSALVSVTNVGTAVMMLVVIALQVRDVRGGLTVRAPTGAPDGP